VLNHNLHCMDVVGLDLDLVFVLVLVLVFVFVSVWEETK
jgi:hypothetical protein